MQSHQSRLKFKGLQETQGGTAVLEDTGEERGARAQSGGGGGKGKKEASPTMPALSVCSQRARGSRVVIWNEFRKPRLILSTA